MHYRHSLKRIFDLLFTIPGLIITSPFLIIISGMVYKNMGLPILFQQQRAGFRGKPFYIYKFRTMTNAVDAYGNLLSDNERLTLFGKWLRDTSLDELPELINVIKGDMSLVGPRPLHIRYNDRYNDTQKKRLNALPGITGLAQIHGRNSLEWEKKFELDIKYIEHWNIITDIKILLQTFMKVIQREGITHKQEATMPEFLGTSSTTDHH